MSLRAAVEARLSAARLVQLTRPDPGETTVDTDLLDLAVADAEAEFAEEVGVALDSTVAAHVAAGVQGVVYYLQSYSGQKSEAARSAWDRGLLRLARSLGGSAPILPQTISPLEVETPTRTRRPDNDRDAWGDVILGRGPGRGDRDERD